MGESSGMEPTTPGAPHSTIATHFAALKDPRVVGRSDHDLLDILTIAILAVICGAKGWEDIEDWAEDHATWLQTFLRLPNGIPQHDCYRRVLAALDPTAFAACFTAWMQALVGSTAGKLIALDGKTMRRSFDRARGRSALHLVSAWVAANGVALGQVVTDAKSNEITAIPALLDLLDLRGAVVSIDAMGCQKDIAAKIVDGGADYLLSLKDNHPTAHAEVAAYFAGAINTPTVHSHETTDGDHGRIEVRRVHVTTDLAWFADRAAWKGLQSFVMVESTRDLGTTVQHECRYFLGSQATTDAAAVGTYVRDHWSVENALHWTLDVTFREDDCRIRDGHGPQNFAWLRKLALTLLTRTPYGRRSLVQRQKLADRNHDYLLSVLAAGSQAF
jgi:predicted transposase YbfD/YdcC